MTIPSAEWPLSKSVTVCAVFTVLQPLPWAPVLPCSAGGEVLSIDRALASKNASPHLSRGRTASISTLCCKRHNDKTKNAESDDGVLPNNELDTADVSILHDYDPDEIGFAQAYVLQMPPMQRYFISR